MTERRKRFTFDEDVNEDDMYEMGVFLDNGKVMETIDVLNCLNNLHEENEQLRQTIIQLKSSNEAIKWARENTVWEIMPTNRRTYTETSYKK